jgi:hypothetical protein
MPAKKLPFSLALSAAELGWLAGAFGLTRLALPVNFSPPTEEALRAVQETLAARSLIRRDPGVGWKVDQLAAFLVQWLGAGDRYLRLDVDRRNMDSLRAGLYARPGLFLLADCCPEQVEFFFLPDEKSFADQLAVYLDLAPGRVGEGEFTLPQPRELIRAAWQDLGPARRALVNAGLSKQEAASALAWVQSLKTVATFSPVPQEEKEPLLLCADGSALWAGAAGKFVPTSWPDAVRRVQEML